MVWGLGVSTEDAKAAVAKADAVALVAEASYLDPNRPRNSRSLGILLICLPSV